MRKHEGALRLSTWGTYCICVHVCLPTHPWILSWGKNRSTGLKVRLKKCSPKPNATLHSNLNRVGWLPGLILHGSFLLTSQITSKTLRAIELTFRAGSMSDQLPTVKVLALQWTHWSHFFSQYELTAFFKIIPVHDLLRMVFFNPKKIVLLKFCVNLWLPSLEVKMQSGERIDAL